MGVTMIAEGKAGEELGQEEGEGEGPRLTLPETTHGL